MNRCLRLLSAVLLVLLFVGTRQGRAQNVTIIGTIQGANGLPASNVLLNFTPTQTMFLPGTNTTQPVDNLYSDTDPAGACAVSAQFSTNIANPANPRLWQCLFGQWVLISSMAIELTGTTATIAGTSLTNTCDSGAVTVPGATMGHPVGVSSTTGADVGGAFNLRASVTAANTVTVYVCGNGTPPSLAYNVSTH